MEQYRRVEKQKVEDQIKENEIRVTTQGKMRSFISYATTLLKEKGFSEIVLKAMGRAINKTVTIAEIIKRRIPNLHQITEIDSTDITDVWEPLQEGLDRLEMTRHVSSIQIRLSTAELDTTSPGYQPPLPQDQVKPVDEETTAALEIEVGEKPRRRGRGRGRGRGRSEEHGEEQESHETHTAPPRRNNNTNALANNNNNNNTEETGSGERGRRGGRGARRGRGGFVGDKTRPSRTHGAEGEAQGTEYGDRNDQAPSSFRGRGRRGGRGGARFSEHGEGEADQGPSFRRGRRGGRGGFGDGAARFSEHADGEAEQGSFRRGRRGGFRGNRGDGAARFSEQHGEGETDQGTSFRGRGRGGFRGTRGRGFGRGARGDRGGRDTSQNTQQ